MSILNIEGVTKVFGDKRLFDSVCLGIEEGDKIGIIGVNGSGKSTLLKMIAGLEEPDEGSIIRSSQADLAYLSQNTEFEPGDTVLSYVMRGKSSSNPGWNLEAEAKTILRKMYVEDTNALIEPLSGGEKKRIALARTLLAPAKILILDEPTNHLDSRMVMWLEEYLANYKGVLLMVTHDRYFLDRVTTKIVEVDRGRIYTYDTNYSGYLDLKEQRLNSEEAGYRKIQSLLKSELEWVRRGAQARSTKQKARLERFQEMQAVKAPEQMKQVEMDSVASRLGRKTIELEHVTKRFGERTVIRDFTYYTIRNERIGIVGQNGCGKTTLLRLITGMEQPEEGTVTIGETVKIGYFSQMAESLNLQERVIDAVKDVAEYIKTSKGTTSASQMCERFLFTPEIQYNPIGKLSGGERRRLALLKVLMTAPNVLILDEPTNDLDITTLTVLEDYLDHFDGIVIAVSHDRYFLDRIVQRILAFEENGTIVQYEGNYTDYLEKTKEKQAVVFTEKPKKTKDTWKSEHTKKLKFSYKEQREYETIDEDIASLEAEISKVDKKMEESASDYGALQKLTEEKAVLEQTLEEKMDRWVYLNDLAEQIGQQ